jgi:hypothetical protein
VERDLAATTRWPAFTRAAARLGVTAVFAYPVQVGAARAGAVVLHRCAPAPAADPPHADILALVQATTRLVLAILAEVPSDGVPAAIHDATIDRATVHNATGMVAAQMNVSVLDALVTLRARAFADGRTVGDVAADVVARRLRFDQPRPAAGGSPSS